MKKIHVITPVKDSADTALRTIESVSASETTTQFRYTVYDDFSNDETIAALREAQEKFAFELVHLRNITTHPSPNYLLVLQLAQQEALKEDAHLVIIESDVVIGPDTLQRMQESAASLNNAGMLGAVTTDETGSINFPYLYARRYPTGDIQSPKRISFCCSLLSNTLLASYDFHHLNPEKTWFDVSISHKAKELGYNNYLLTGTPVVHYPHSSRPWKNLKRSNPVRYYWQKFVERRERI